MFLLLILAAIAVFCVLFVVSTIGVVGATGIIVFGDVIVCIAGIVLLIVYIIKRKKK